MGGQEAPGAGAPRVRLGGVVLGSPDPRALATFYEQLLGLVRLDDSVEWVRIAAAAEARPSIGFQREPDFVPRVGPQEEGAQQRPQHLDVAPAARGGAVARAETRGARRAGHQPQDDVRVMFDPDGHVFCLFDAPHLFG